MCFLNRLRRVEESPLGRPKEREVLYRRSARVGRHGSVSELPGSEASVLDLGERVARLFELAALQLYDGLTG